jgi:RecQ-mediated genome instability protein 1
MNGFMSTIRPSTPIAALQRTALFRILATDLSSSIQAPSPASLFPANISSPDTQELKLAGPIAVQVLDIEDIGHSRWSQVENIEAHERGEMTKGREIIRVVADETNSDPNHTPEAMASSGPHKLLLQDCKGTNVYAFELDSINGVSVQMPIGSKLVLKDVTVARGVILLEPKSVEVLGGKVEAWDKKWRNERKSTLKRKAVISADDAG